MTLEESEGYMELEMLEEAWASIDDLPPELSHHPRAIRVRMFAAFGLRRLEMAEALAMFLGSPSSDYRIEAAEILQRLAAIHASDGNRNKARELVKYSIEADPDRRLKILEDRSFPPDFF